MTSSSTHFAVHPYVSFKRLWQVGVFAALLAACLTTGISVFAGILFHIPETFLPLRPGPTATFTILGVFGATLVFAALVRLTKRPVRIFLMVAALVLVISLLPDIAIIGNPSPAFMGGTAIAIGILLCEHILVAVISVSLLITVGPVRKG